MLSGIEKLLGDTCRSSSRLGLDEDDFPLSQVRNEDYPQTANRYLAT